MSKKKLMVIGPVVLLVLVAAAYVMVLKPKPVVDEEELAKAPGPTYVMADPFVVNLADRDATHFVKVGVALRFSELSAAKLPGGGHGTEPVHIEEDPELRDIIIATFQSMTTKELSSAKGRKHAKEEIVHKINEHTELKILDVYYTEFAVQ